MNLEPCIFCDETGLVYVEIHGNKTAYACFCDKGKPYRDSVMYAPSDRKKEHPIKMRVFKPHPEAKAYKD